MVLFLITIYGLIINCNCYLFAFQQRDTSAVLQQLSNNAQGTVVYYNYMLESTSNLYMI